MDPILKTETNLCFIQVAENGVATTFLYLCNVLVGFTVNSSPSLLKTPVECITVKINRIF